MTQRTSLYKLHVASTLYHFIDQQVLPGTGVSSVTFWKGFDQLVQDLAPQNIALLAERDRLQLALDEWHRTHLMNPRDVVPESNMPAFAFLAARPVDAEMMPKKMTALRQLGDPYTDADIANAAKAVEGKTEMDALIAYLQGLGLVLKNKR